MRSAESIHDFTDKRHRREGGKIWARVRPDNLELLLRKPNCFGDGKRKAGVAQREAEAYAALLGFDSAGIASAATSATSLPVSVAIQQLSRLRERREHHRSSLWKRMCIGSQSWSLCWGEFKRRLRSGAPAIMGRLFDARRGEN